MKEERTDDLSLRTHLTTLYLYSYSIYPLRYSADAGFKGGFSDCELVYCTDSLKYCS